MQLECQARARPGGASPERRGKRGWRGKITPSRLPFAAAGGYNPDGGPAVGLGAASCPRGGSHVALTNVDRTLLQRCLTHQPGAWNDFVDRYVGLIYHVIHHTSHLRSQPLSPEDTEDMAQEVLLQIVQGDYAILRQFQGKCSLATYLTVIARRICVNQLAQRLAARDVQPSGGGADLDAALPAPDQPARGQVGLESLEEVQK